MNHEASGQVRLRTLIIAEDLLTGSGLHALLLGQAGIDPIAHLVSYEHSSIETYEPEVLLWDFGWSVDSDQTYLAEVDFADQGHLHGVPVLALVSDTSQATAIWNAGLRSILLRSESPPALIAALFSTAHGLCTLSPEIASSVSLFRVGDPLSEMEPLTSREVDVLNLMADALTNRAIAQRLSISEHTVKFHVNSILGKLGAEGRTDAVVRAARAGLILL